MARGLGKVQVGIVERLRLAAMGRLGRFVDSQTPVELACHIYGCAPQEVTDNQLQAIRKALKSLHRYSIVELVDYRSLEGERKWKLDEHGQSSRKLKKHPPPANGLTIVKS